MMSRTPKAEFGRHRYNVINRSYSRTGNGPQKLVSVTIRTDMAILKNDEVRKYGLPKAIVLQRIRRLNNRLRVRRAEDDRLQGIADRKETPLTNVGLAWAETVRAKGYSA